METILSIKNLFYKVKSTNFLVNKEKTIIDDITVDVDKGEIIGIAGESGSGKTTLAKLITGIITPTSGSIKLNTKEKKKCNPIQILFQNNGQILNPHRKIDDIVEEAIKLREIPSDEIANEKEKIFSAINFPEQYRKNKGFQLSGGQQQRAALARLIAVKPEILILDEPFSAQDYESLENLSALFKKINIDLGITLICISHDLNVLRELCNRVVIIYRGKIVEIGNTKEVLSNPKHPYTQYLIKSENYDLTHKELMDRAE